MTAGILGQAMNAPRIVPSANVSSVATPISTIVHGSATRIMSLDPRGEVG